MTETSAEQEVKSSNTTQNQETLSFQSEVAQLLDLMIHSLYSNKEIFLRELISNASDALDKRRFLMLANDELKQDSPLAITVSLDKDKKLVKISDNGIGMNREEIISQLGTIARSGTKAFLKEIKDKANSENQLIGQFGVGFYSSFIVADKVSVLSRKAGESASQGVRWTSAGDGEFTVENIQKSEAGTEVILHLKDDQDEFLESYRVKNVVLKYADHLSFPIYMEKPAEPAAADSDKSEAEKSETQEAKEPEFEVINQATALWTVSKSELKDEDYTNFYKHFSHDYEDPLTWSHNRVEGKLEYTSLLYIPKRAPFDLFQREQKFGLKLYVQRVFIMDEAEAFLPPYLRFVKGIVDSNDLPLNVSREILQQNKTVDSIKSANAKKVLGMIEQLVKNKPEEFESFYKNFGEVLKEGIVDDYANRERIAKLLRFSSTTEESENPSVSFEDYISRMKEKQEAIYYVTGESLAACKSSPHLEVFKKNGIEVLLLCNRVDEWLVSHLTEFDGRSLKSVAKGALDLGDLDADKPDEETVKRENDEFEGLITRIKAALGDDVKDVRITHRLTDSPACIVADENDMGLQMQRILQSAGQELPPSAPIFEINPSHSIIKKLNDETSEDKLSDWSRLLFDQSILADGGQIKDPALFVKRLNKLLMD